MIYGKFAKMFSIKEVGDIIVRDILPNGRNRNDKWTIGRKKILG